MPYADPQRGRAAAKERRQRWRARQHAEKYGPDAGDQRGKHGKQPKGSTHHRWNTTRLVNEDGYIKIRVGTDHPLADPHGYAYEHLVVWCAAGNPRPQSDETLHHRNEDKTDNRIRNLKLLKRGEHNALHIIERGRRANGQFAANGEAAGRLLDGREHNDMPEHLRVREFPRSQT